MAFKPSKYQQAFYDWVQNGAGDAVLQAVAGSGKTTSSVAAMKLIPTSKRVLFLAFNKSIAEELKARAPAHADVMTLNSLGHRAWMRAAGRVQLAADKTRLIINEALTEFEAKKFGPAVRKLVSVAKAHGLVPQGVRGAQGMVADTDKAWLDLIEHYDVDLGEEANDEEEMAAINLARRVLALSCEQRQVIDFDDQLYLSVIYGANPPRYDWVFVDEAQDLSPIQQRLVELARAKGGRIVAVGDSCQPSGTKVLAVVNKSGDVVERKIENIEVGDLVVAFDQVNRSFVNGRRVNGVTERHFQGQLIKAEIEGGRSTRYTPNHLCIANFASLRDQWAVYLMRRGKHFRIGRAKMNYAEIGSGPVCRMRAEQADAVWILSLHGTKAEAHMAEQIIAANYGMPQLTFEPGSNDAVFCGKEALEKAWEAIWPNEDRALRCLAAYHRDIDYPIFCADQEPWKYSLKRPMVVRACNLIDGCLLLPARKDSWSGPIRRLEWTPCKISWEPYDGSVWSLDVDRDHTYVADEIVTHNCQAIYGFRGADSNAMANFRDRLKATTLHLSICYRCPRGHIALAKGIVPQIEAADTAPEGEIADLGSQWKPEAFRNDDLIICRNSAPLVKAAYRILAAKVPVRILGRDLGTGLVSLIKKLKAKTRDHLVDKLEKWKDRECATLQRKDPEANLDKVIDRYDTIQTFLDMFPSAGPEGIIREIEKLYSDNTAGILTLSTVHKAKGLESERVFILNRELMPAKSAKKPWQREQERNIEYIAYTRAKQFLGFIQIDTPKKGKK